MSFCGGDAKRKWLTDTRQRLKRVFYGVKEKGITSSTTIECNTMERINGVDNDSVSSVFVEFDPTGRYGRFNEILGKGASKTVYRAFDENRGIEVAWNQVKLNGVLQSHEDVERFYSEIHLLESLSHKNIMTFYTYWLDAPNRKINFITELFTSGTLRQYRLKYKTISNEAIKNWCRQILNGLLYLHSLDPPVIHRDLKCDNIFVHGSHGEIKIGDLGLAAIHKKSKSALCVGTPEFMAPEVYKEDYNELVDIYSFGMCVLEMVTFEYPYSECISPAHILAKVTSGKKPDAYYKVKDQELRQFIDKCLTTASSRLSARELLNDPFLCIYEYESDKHMGYDGEAQMDPYIRQPLIEHHDCHSSFRNGRSNGFGFGALKECGYEHLDNKSDEIKIFEHSTDMEISIKGKRKEGGNIFLKLRIADKEGRVRYIHFPFEIANDTALSVTTEMIRELDITDQDITKIANAIDGEILSLVPQWKPGAGVMEIPVCGDPNSSNCCASDHTSYDSSTDFTNTNPDSKNRHVLQCCSHGCSSVHGRFEEVTCKADESERYVEDGAAKVLSQTDFSEFSSEGSSGIDSDEYYETLQSFPSTEEELTSGCNQASNTIGATEENIRYGICDLGIGS